MKAEQSRETVEILLHEMLILIKTSTCQIRKVLDYGSFFTEINDFLVQHHCIGRNSC